MISGHAHTLLLNALPIQPLAGIPDIARHLHLLPMDRLHVLDPLHDVLQRDAVEAGVGEVGDALLAEPVHAHLADGPCEHDQRLLDLREPVRPLVLLEEVEQRGAFFRSPNSGRGLRDDWGGVAGLYLLAGLWAGLCLVCLVGFYLRLRCSDAHGLSVFLEDGVVELAQLGFSLPPPLRLRICRPLC